MPDLPVALCVIHEQSNSPIIGSIANGLTCGTNVLGCSSLTKSGAPIAPLVAATTQDPGPQAFHRGICDSRLGRVGSSDTMAA